MVRSSSLAGMATALALLAAPVSAQLTTPLDSATLAGMPWRAIGPVQMGGRITDIEAVPTNPRVFYIAAASGGIWKTVNAGTTFFPLFTNEKVVSMGDLAITPSNPNIVWAGTGEEDSRNSISPGGGIYKSTDAGLTWQLMGLEKTETISRILVHPSNPDVVWVAALGAIWRSNPERGIYKTVDGGRTWTMSKFISDKAGFIDLAMDPRDPNVLYAASWERQRGPYFLRSGGAGSALWKSTDGGTTWTEIKGGGFPATPKGRIGLAIAPSSPDIVYAMVEADSVRGQQPKRLLNGIYRSSDAGKTWTWVNTVNDRPFYYSQIRVDPKNPERIYRLAAAWHFSDDGGKSWRQGAQGHHGDHHALWINPNDPDHFIIGSDGGVAQTFDKGGTYDVMNYMPLGQFYAVSYDMAVPYRVCGGLQDNGSWCGPSRKRSGSIIASDWFNVGGGDGFWTQQDPTDPDVIYAESQGGAMQRRNIRTGEGGSTRPGGFNRQQAEQRRRAIWGDTTPVQGGGRGGAPTPTPKLTAEQQRLLAELNREIVTDSGANATRWNWNTPFILSAHNSNVFYTGGTKVYKSTDRGMGARAISPDLTTNDTMRVRVSTTATGGITADNTGAETHSTIVSLSESPIRAGILYAGTDDGNVWMTRNDGGNWENLTARIRGVPPKAWISHVEASKHDSATVYVAVDAHWDGDFTPYVFISTDFGRTFRSIAGDLPKDRPNFLHVITEDPVNRNLLYAGTDVGVWVTLNRGNTWQKFMTGLPSVPVHDLKVHPRDRELIAGTHGRSVWIADVAPLQQMTDSVMRKPVHLFAPKPAFQWNEAAFGEGTPGHRTWRGTGAPYGAVISYYLGSRASGPVGITITNVAGDTVGSMTGPMTPGVQSVTWNFMRTGFTPGFGGGGGGGRGGAAGPPPAFPGFPGGFNARPGEAPGAASTLGDPNAPIAATGPGGGGGGGGGFGQGGGAPLRPVDTGDYLVTLNVGGQKLTKTLRVIRVGDAGTVVTKDLQVMPRR